jgi:hypothetical protein
MRHDGRVASVRGLICELQKLVGRRLKIVRGHKPSSVFFQHGKPRMSVCEVKLPALQMQNALSRNVAEFGRFNRVQSVFAGPKSVKHIVTSGIACMNCGALIPVRAVHFEVVGHANSM